MNYAGKNIRTRKLVAGAGVAVEALEARRLLTAGQPDLTFGVHGTVSAAIFADGEPRAIVLQQDGKLVAAGSTQPDGLTDSLGSFAIARFNPDGSLDHGFGPGGTVATHFGGVGATDVATSVAVQRDGKIVVAGYELLNDGQGDGVFAVARYLPAGGLDPLFGSGGIATVSFPVMTPLPGVPLLRDVAKAIAVQADGKIVLAGALQSADGVFSAQSTQGAVSEIALARLTANGGLDPSFGTGGRVITPLPPTLNSSLGSVASSLILQKDGRILVGGEIDSGSTKLQVQLATLCYQSNGQLDSSFGIRGEALGGTAPQGVFSDVNLAQQRDGKIVAETGTEVVRFTSTGGIDSSFGVRGIALTLGEAGAQDISVRKDGDIILYGTEVDDFGDSLGFAVSALKSNGKPDTNFGVGGTVVTPFQSGGGAFAGIAQPDGHVVAIGFATGGWTLARYTLSGKLDGSFGYHGTVQVPDALTGPITAIALQNDGKIIVAGSELSVAPGVPTDAALARYNPDGSLDTTFGTEGKMILRIGDNAAYTSLVIAPDGDIVAGGYGQSAIFGAASKINLFAIVRLHSNGSGDQTFGAGGVVLTSFGDPGGQQCNGVAVDSNNNVIAAGSTSTHMAVARYLPNGSLDPSFGSSGKLLLDPLHNGAQANAVALQKNGQIVIAGTTGAGFGTMSSSSKFATIRLRANGSLDSTFAAGGIAATVFTDSFGAAEAAQGFALAIDKAGDILVGGEMALNSTFSTIIALVRYLPQGTLDPNFGTGGIVSDTMGISSVNAIAIQNDGKILVGGGGPMVARLLTNGAYDTTFGTDHDGIMSYFGFLGGPTASIVIQPNGSILIGAVDLSRITGYGTSDLAAFKTVYSTNGGTPANAVDGSLTTDFAAVPIPSGPSQGQNWLIIDLGAVYNISEVVVTFDGDPSPAQFQIKSGFDSSNWPQSTPWMTAVAGANYVTGLTLSGRYVLVYLSATPVNIAEVSVFGT